MARTGSSLLHKAGVPAAKSFTTRATIGSLYTTTLRQPSKVNRYARLLSNSAVQRDQTQPAPNAKAYLESGVIKGTENPVNVKKVLVIGSGGLSIGQAGEFDYSGTLTASEFDFLWICHSSIQKILYTRTWYTSLTTTDMPITQVPKHSRP